jgi:hypothetical protein
MGEDSSGKNRQGFRERCQAAAQGFSNFTKKDGSGTESTMGEDQGGEEIVLKTNTAKRFPLATVLHSYVKTEAKKKLVMLAND